ncbi:eye-specific diacylglycerol kinase isoform X2 [Vespa velutina]|uniref:eye-specific diacylglycerol kinase isoform X2 n=1 Tax=Vespa velutina TaxID=202808 RepID=UPI001FB478D9|nr:eye-specific diacylglycerol kinase isoform X2 [Vespa velutina]
MQRFRSTFKRSRTPTGAEMKSQSSLEVPKQVRSASFDEIQLEAQRQDDGSGVGVGCTVGSTGVTTGITVVGSSSYGEASRSPRTTSSSSSSCSPARSQESIGRGGGRRSSTLRVPQFQTGQRSKSFDVYERNVGLPPSQSSLGAIRRFIETPTIQVSGCYHCACVEEYKSLFLSRDDDETTTTNTTASSSRDDEDVDVDDDENNGDDGGDNVDVSVTEEDRDVDEFIDDAADEDEDEEYRSEDEQFDYKVESKRDGSPEIRVTFTAFNENITESRPYSPSPSSNVIIANVPDNEKANEGGGEGGGGGGGGEKTTVVIDTSNLTGTTTTTEVTSEVKDELYPERQRRRSISYPKLSRQEALTSYPSYLSSSSPSGSREDEEKDDYQGAAGGAGAGAAGGAGSGGTGAGGITDNINLNEEPDNNNDVLIDSRSGKSKLVVRNIFLTVPELKRDRAASVDSCFNNNKNDKSENYSHSLDVPQQSIRSKSVDIVLPTEVQTRYTALLPGTNEARPPRGGREEGAASGGQRELRSTPDWGGTAFNGEHFWVPTAASGDFCYVNDCSKHGPRMKCSACRVVVHALCVPSLNFTCKTSFRDVGVRQYREQTTTNHHWVHRRSQKGKCSNCGKSFQSKLSFTSKEIVAVNCSWCKAAYHNKEACFNVDKIGENCELGVHSSIIVPPSWIVKLPRKGSFKSSLRKSPKRRKSGSGPSTSNTSRRKSRDKEKEKEQQKEDQGKFWAVKPIPTATVRPVLVFINPKSGGNQGAKLLQKFQWLLNPRQVFDLTQGGPKMGLELFKRVPNLRVLACGGDGTVGWVLSILDQIGASSPPAVGVLPLGTGNDLARALGWGGGYTDEPIGKILSSIGESETILLDRWQLVVERNPEIQNDDDSGKAKENLPLNVVNNYFSLGVDAHIALEFHEAREAHPEKFNSRLRNKMFYGQMGGKDLVRRKWKDLSEFVTLECDGQDLTPKLKEHRVHAIVFLNIASYGGGTHPWCAGSTTKEPSTEDGLIEVVGLTTYQLPLLQAGGHGTCIAQCSKAKLVTTRTIPMQVDGEACRLLPSIINLSLLNKATMLAKRRNTGQPQQDIAKLERLNLPVMRIKMSDYETYYHDKERLKKVAESLMPDSLDLDATTDLVSLRNILAKNHNMDACCFLDSCTAERFFRIDRAQEQLHYVTDVAADVVYILEESSPSQVVPTIETEITASQEPETAHPSPSEERHPREKPAMTKAGPTTTCPDNDDGRSSKVVKEDESNEDKLAQTKIQEEQVMSPKGTEIVVKSKRSRNVTLQPNVSNLPKEEVEEMKEEEEQQEKEKEKEEEKEKKRNQKQEDEEVQVKVKLETKEVEDPGESQNTINVGTRKKTMEEVKDDDGTKETPSKQSGSSSKAINASNADRSADQTSITFISPRDRLFGLSSEVHTFNTGLLEKTSDGILKAAKIGDLTALKELHEKGYSLLSIDTTGQTALHLASRYGHKNIIRYLIACAPPTILDIVDNDKGQTALHKAAQHKKRTICCMLVAGGANLTVKDRHGHTPRQLALMAEDRELAAYLQIVASGGTTIR